MSRRITQGFAKLMPLSMIAILVSSLFLFTAISFQTAQPALAAADDYAVSGADPTSLPDVGAASVALGTITLTDADGDDFSDVDATEIFDVVINTTAYPSVQFDTSVVFGGLTVAGDCGHNAASALTYTGTTTAHVTVTGAGGAATCAAGEIITIAGLKIETLYAATAPGAAHTVTVDNATTSAGSPVSSSTTVDYAITAADAAASIVMAAPTVGAAGDTTATLTVPFALDADDTVDITFPAHVDVSGVGAAVTGTFEAAANITCAAAAQVVTCTTDGATATTGTIIMTGITNSSVATTDITVFEVEDEGAAANDIATDSTVALTDAIPADPVITSATMNYNDDNRELVVTGTDFVSGCDLTKFHLNDATGVDDVTLTGAACVVTNGTTLTITLTEAQRVAALALSGVTGGDAGAVVLDVDAAGISNGTNGNVMDDNNAVAETADTKVPTLASWSIDFSASTLTMIWDETVLNTGGIDELNITLQDAATAVNPTFTLTGGSTASADGTTSVIDLTAGNVNSIKADVNICLTTANCYIIIATNIVDDMATNDNAAVADGAGIMATGVTGGAAPGAFTTTSVSLSSTLASASSTATIAMTLANTLPDDGIIEVTFPAGFGLTGVTSAVSVGGFDGTFAVADAGQVLTITRQGDGNPATASSAIALDVGIVVNPGAAGTTGTFAFETQDSGTTVIDTDATVAGVTITTTTTTTTTSGGGGGGGGGSSASTTNTTSNSKTSTSTANIGTITGDQTYSSPLQLKDEVVIIDQDNNTAKAMLTGDGSLLLKPNSKSTIFAKFPANTEVTGPANWNGKIEPPLVKSLSTINKEGEDIKGTTDLLMRSDVEVLVKVGSNVPLTFSNPVALNFPVDLVDGSVVNIYQSEDGLSWNQMKAGVDNPTNTGFLSPPVSKGMVNFQTNQFSYFAVVPTGDAQKIVEVTEGFADIIGHWGATYINEIADLGIVSGKSATSYAPNDNITRAELTKVATKAFGIEVAPVATTSAFGDVAVSAWYTPYINAARDAGIVQGVDGKFSPNAPITRAAALKILLESAGFGETTAKSDFDDVPASAWFAGYVSFASQNGVVSGYQNGSFGPGNNITRAEVAKVVVKIMELQE